MQPAVSLFGYRRLLALGVLVLAACAPAPAVPVPFPPSTPPAAPTPVPTSILPAASTAMPTLTSSPVPTPVPPLPPVQVDGLGLAVAGRPFRFVGANAIYFGFYPDYGYSLEDAIKSARANGITVLRLYLGFGEETWGGKPFEEYDKALALAAQNGVYVIATLTDCCCLGGDWSQTPGAYFSKVPYCDLTSTSGLTAFEDYIKTVVRRKNTVNGKLYRDDTTILAWDVANEQALQLFTDAEFHAWLGKVTAYLKALDPQHLVTVGIDGSREVYNQAGAHYEALNVPDLDFYAFHYNLPHYSAVAGQLDSIRSRTQTFLSMGKPVVLEEFGVGSERGLGQPVNPATLDSWLKAYRDQMDTAFSAGASGVMFWGWGVPETKAVPLWWKLEDHDVTETEFSALIREYQMPPANFTPNPAPSVSTPKPAVSPAQPAYVKAFCTLIGNAKKTDVAPDAPVTLVWGWDAKTEAQIHDFLENHLTTLTLDGKSITVMEQSPIQINDKTGRYEVVWSAAVGLLSPGQHTLLYEVKWKKQISDGTNTYGPGSKTETLHDACDITVK